MFAGSIVIYWLLREKEQEEPQKPKKVALNSPLLRYLFQSATTYRIHRIWFLLSTCQLILLISGFLQGSLFLEQFTDIAPTI